jgi:hypothetical protein
MHQTHAPRAQVRCLELGKEFWQAAGMIHHDEQSSSAQQMPSCLDQLGQGDGEFVPRYRLLWVWIQTSMAHSTVGRITYHSTEQAGREKRCYLAHVTLDDPYTVLQTITNHILPGEHDQRALEF